MRGKRKLSSVATGISILIYSNSVLALEKVKLRGNELEVKDNDIVSMIIEIAIVFVAIVAGFFCIQALFETLQTLWAKWGEVRKGQAQLNDLFWPLTMGVGLVIVTFAITYYLVTNFDTFI